MVLEEKGILEIIFNYQDQGISMKELLELAKDGKESVRSGVNELINKGYVEKVELQSQEEKER